MFLSVRLVLLDGPAWSQTALPLSPEDSWDGTRFGMMDERRGDLSINLPSAGNVTDVVADSGGLLLPMLCPIPALVTGCVGKGCRGASVFLSVLWKFP